MEKRKNISRRNIILGTLIALIGGLLLLNNFGLLGISLSYYIFSWKTLLIVIGLFMILNSRTHITGGLIVASIGIIFWLPEFLNQQLVFHQILWPSVLIVVGLVFLLKAAGIDNKKSHKPEFAKYEEVNSTTSEDKKAD